MNTWKHGIIGIIAIIALAFTACDDDPAHTHQWNEWSTTAPTCMTTGTVNRKCSVCGAVGAVETVIPIDPNAHNYGNWTQSTGSILIRICSHNNSHTTTSNEMVSVQGGTFQLGNPDSSVGYSDERPVSNVTLSSFYIGKYEVTQAQWQAVMGTTIQQLQTAASVVTTNWGRGNAYPVYFVNWYHALVFCNKLSVTEGLTPAYRIMINGTYTTNPDDWGTVPTSSNPTWNAVTIVDGSTGYRLPTEAQWEYAAKGGNTGETFTYAGSNTVGDVAWYSLNNGSEGTSTYGAKAVGTKAPNGLGIYDMSGNVEEWCWDRKGNYTSGDKIDPTGAGDGSTRVERGGFWFSLAENVRSAYRVEVMPLFRNYQLGFRLARPVN